MTLRCEVVDGLTDVDASAWNRVAGDTNPFLRHEFLIALERHGCVGEKTGWEPRHLVLFDEHDRLVGASPMYIKYHSYGEYVFDWSWADAYNRYGHRYYPKLVGAIPFTPVSGPRLLCAGAADASLIRRLLVDAALQVAEQLELSSIHWLFTDRDDQLTLDDEDLLTRTGCQYHWHNQGFRDFDDFLDTLTSKRRKQIKRERRQTRDAGLQVRMCDGADISSAEWDAFYEFYCATYDKKWGAPYLTRGFFHEIGATLPDSVSLALASRGEYYVAGALCLKDSEAMFGRNWGCSEFYPGLHFELCYYQTIERCITLGLSRFEAGAQGEYKVNRGLMPTTTRSTHWIAHPDFRRAIGHFINEEQVDVSRFVAFMEDQHSPYNQRRQGDKSPGEEPYD